MKREEKEEKKKKREKKKTKEIKRRGGEPSPAGTWQLFKPYLIHCRLLTIRFSPKPPDKQGRSCDSASEADF